MKQIQQHTLQVAVALTADGACMAGICLASACLPPHQAVVLAGIGCFIVAAVSILWLSARRMHQETSARSELDQTLRHMQEIQLQKRKEQLNALQNQINPHFLYNTLDTIRGLAIERVQWTWRILWPRSPPCSGTAWITRRTWCRSARNWIT